MIHNLLVHLHKYNVFKVFDSLSGSDFTNHPGEFTDICVICGATDVAGGGSIEVLEAVGKNNPS